MGVEFTATMAELRTQTDLRTVVLTGAGRAFSAGGDFDFLTARPKFDPEENTKAMIEFYQCYLSVRSLQVPVVAAINGAAVGAGMALAVATDIRVAFADAKMGYNFVRLGIHPGMGSTYYLPKAIGPQNAAKLMLTGELIDGAEARRLGLVVEALSKADEVLPYALGVARKIAQNAPVAVRTLTQTLRMQQDEEVARSLLREASAQAACYPTAAYVEGLTAVKEKRDPVF